MIGFAQLVSGTVLNSLPEGLLIALCAWLLLRVMGRQNSRTRFAVWMVALAAVVAMPVLGSLHMASHSAIAAAHPEFTVPADWALGFLAVWMLIGSLVLARVVAGILQVRQLRHNCQEVSVSALDPELQAVMQQTKRPVRLLVSDTARVPAAVGFRKPAVILPAWALDELATAELKPILIHELAHLQRHDDWTNLLQKTLRAIFFFHPAVWWIDARLSIERELACDDAVLAATGNARAYAGCLIDLLERGCARRGWTMAQALMAHAKDASTRIARILQTGTPRSTRVGRAALGLAATLSLACAGIAACVPSLVGFEPEHAVAAAHFSPRFSESEMHPPQSDVVPAAYHPEQRFAPAHRAVRHRAITSAHPPELRRLIAARPAPPPVVMARLAVPADRPAGAPMLVFFADSDSGPTEIAARKIPPTAALLVTGQDNQELPLQIRSLEFRGLQFQFVQIVTRSESPAGVQVIRMELVISSALQQGVRPKSI